MYIRPLARGVLLLCFGLLAAIPANAFELVSHRSVYALKLGTVKQGVQFVGARGGLDMSIEKTCDGWVMNQQLTVELDTSVGGQVRQAVRFTGWESLDGKRYRFVARSQAGDRRLDSKGTATAPQGGKPGRVEFTLPKVQTLELPAHTRFPVTHAAWLIETAKTGSHTAPSVVFDGSDGEGPQQVAAFIGKRVEAKDHGKGKLGPLAQLGGWPMRLAFFPLGGKDAPPDYEMEVVQLENGVATKLVLDYPDFSIVLEINKIEPLPAPKCD